MLYVVSGTKEVEWYVGKRWQGNPELVTLVQADGDELELILSECSNIPKNKQRLMCWHGDFAKFIASTLRSLFPANF